jgi:hypothetical protein
MEGLPGSARRTGRPELLKELTLHIVDDGAEEVLLVAEVVVEGPSGDACPPHDLFGRGVGVAALREEGAGGREQCPAGGLRLF